MAKPTPTTFPRDSQEGSLWAVEIGIPSLWLGWVGCCGRRQTYSLQAVTVGIGGGLPSPCTLARSTLPHSLFLAGGGGEAGV